MQKINFDTIPKYRGFSLSNKLLRLAWRMMEVFFFKTSIYPSGRYIRVGLLKMFGAQISWRTVVYPSSRIWAPWNLEVGARSVIGPNVFCYNPDKIVIGKKVTISQDVYLCGGGHDISKVLLPFEKDKIVINDYAWVCARSFVKYGVEIGEGAIVGATASVYSNVPPYTVVGGNPARFIKQRELKERSSDES